MRLRPYFSLIAVLAGACSDLPPKQLNVCGNGVVEPQIGEQCDLTTSSNLGPDTQCGKPDDTPARACHYVCTPGATLPKCPTHWICDTDSICRSKIGVCGNGIVDAPNEDCDLNPDPKLGDGTMCGAPDAPSGACRYVCMSGMDLPRCPSGWSCGSDNICRYPSGAFEEPMGPRDLSVLDIGVGDFDGDGYPDVGGFDETHVRALYGASDRTLGHEYSLNVDVLTGPPALADIDQDGLTDLALPERNGIFVLRGQRDRSFAPVAFSPIGVPLHQLQVLPAFWSKDAIESIPLVVGKGINNNLRKFILLIAVADTAGAVPQGCEDTVHTTCFDDAGHAFSDIAGRIPIANIHNDTVHTQIGEADEIVVGLLNDTFVRIFAPQLICTGPNMCVLKPVPLDHETVTLPGPIALPLGGRDTGAVQIADLNGDGNKDLVVSITDASGNPALAVAWGDGLGRFYDAAGVPDRASIHRFPVMTSSNGQLTQIGELGFPFAVGDLNGDVWPDFVGRAAIQVSGMPGPILTNPALVGGANGVFITISQNTRTSSVFAVFAVDPPSTWDEAAIGDFNRDGISDVAAISHTDDNLQILVGAGGGFFNNGLVSTTFSPSSLRIGDYNGDRAADIAFVENGCASSTDATSLSVLFGGLDVFAGNPVPMGCLNYIQQMERGFMAYDFNEPDRTSDLVVVSNRLRDTSGDTSIAIMRGTSQRRMLSPFLLTAGSQRDNVPIGVALGQFQGNANAVDMIATSELPDQIGRPSHPTAWFIKGSGHGKYEAANALPVALDDRSVAHCFDQATFNLACYIWTAGVIDGAPPATIVGFDVSDFCDGKVLNPRSKLVILHPMETNGTAHLTCDRYNLATDRGPAMEVLLADLDGDGKPELVARFATSILVYWNTGSGIVPDPSNISVVPPARGADPVFLPLGIAALNTNSDPNLEIAFATADAIYVSAFDAAHVFHTNPMPAAPRFEVRPTGAPMSTLGSSAPFRLIAADMDRDGLTDLVLLEMHRVHTFFAAEHRAIGAGP